MKRILKLAFLIVLLGVEGTIYASSKGSIISFEFYEGTFNLELDESFNVHAAQTPSPEAAKLFHSTLSSARFKPVIEALNRYKEKHQLNDWLFYQLVRKTSQQISPKADNYFRYTLYKWFLLAHSGYDARLAIAGGKVIFYIKNDEDISDLPFFVIENNKYMCLNYHDFGSIDFHNDPPYPIDIKIPEAVKSFSYKVTRMPEFKPEGYSEKELKFNYRQKAYHFKVKLNPEIQAIFANYPVVDFATYFNIPLSKETYGSLVPLLKHHTRGMSQKKGVDYLMNFTRYAFLYQDDEKIFGKEKRLSPEMTLFSEYSDCDDRAALFFYLVKEIYNLPMIALLYPTHITMAVQLSKPQGTPIEYEGKKYSICEATPQERHLRVGQIAAKLKNVSYQVVYHYDPSLKLSQ